MKSQRLLRQSYSAKTISFNPSEGWPFGKDLYYECQFCKELVSSVENGECSCGNLYVDSDAGRAGAKDEDKIKLFQLTEKQLS